MSKQQATIPAEKVDGVERLCLHPSGTSTTGRSIYHLPKWTKDGVTPLCDTTPRNLRYSSFEVFRRRRNPTLCKKCQERGGEPYSEGEA